MKLLKPQNLDLNTIIKDDKFYSYLTNNQNNLGICFKKGKVIRKLIPAIQYFINQIICTDPAQGNAQVKGFKRIRITDVDNVMSYAKMRQVIHFLVQLKIIEVRGISEYITVEGKQFTINAKYFRLLEPYNQHVEIIECAIKTRRKVNINKVAKSMIASNEAIRHQHELCSNYIFNFQDAEQLVNDLYYSKSIDDKKFVTIFQYLSKLKNKDVIFTISEKTRRIATIVNCCPKIIRPFFSTPDAGIFTELDFATFNVQVLIKLIDDNITISNINEQLIKELQVLTLETQNDFYQHIVKIFENNDVQISRDTAKDIVLWHWINARNDSKNIEYKIMSKIYPEITKMLIVLKGNTYESYKKYSCSFMLVESQLTQEIYTEFHKQFPKAYIYNIYDSFMVENQYILTLKNIMKDVSERYFNREVKIKQK
jgi:hypothetical protein